MIPKMYPIVVDIRELISRELGRPASIDILTKDPLILELSLKRLESALSKGVVPEDNGKTTYEEVASFYLSLAIANALSARVLEKLISAEVERMKRFISRERLEDLLDLCRRLGLKPIRRTESFPWYVDVVTKRITHRVLNVAVGVSEYLSSISEADDPKLFLQNSFVKEGLVFLDRPKLELVVLNVMKKRMREIARSFSEIKFDEKVLGQARAVVSKYLEQHVDEDIIILEVLPPCVSRVLRKAKEEGLKSLDLEEGALLAMFFSNLRSDAALRSLIENDPNLDGFLNIVDLLRKLNVGVPSCDRLKELGLCDERCIERTPFHAYIKNVKKLREDRMV